MTLSQKGICVWTLSNLMRGKPAPPTAVVDEVLGSLPQYTVLDCEEIRSDCLWILSYVSDGDTAGILSVAKTGVVPWVLASQHTYQAGSSTSSKEEVAVVDRITGKVAESPSSLFDEFCTLAV